MLLIFLRDFQKGYRNSYKPTVYLFALLLLTPLLFDLFNYFNMFSQQKLLFLLVENLIKIGFYGYGWLSASTILMQRQKITWRTIIIAITAYLFIGITWSFIYYTILQINPNAFHLNIPEDYELKSWNLVMYFSLTTLTTLGYGDIVPVSRLAMLAANFEAIAGTVYLTVIIARLVSLYSIPD